MLRDAAMWLPVWGAYSPSHRDSMRAVHEGLRAAGVESRVVRVGAPPWDVELLRVRAPHAEIEPAEDWLLRLVQPFDDAGEQWATDLDCVMRYHGVLEFELWGGTSSEVEQFAGGIEPLRAPPAPARMWATCATSPGTDASLVAYARGAPTVLHARPGVEVHGPATTATAREWAALQMARTPDEHAALRAVQQGLDRIGIATTRYEWRAARTSCALLALHVGDASLDAVEAGIAAALPAEHDGWVALYQPWSWRERALVVHRQQVTDLDLRARLERQLGGACVDASASKALGFTLSVRVAYVDRALALLDDSPR